jgi:vancomycin aglycone glucosyltransferase
VKFVVAGYGSRGDVEPCVAAAVELLRRGHDVSLAVPPNMLDFVESVGLAGVAYGPDSREEMNPGSALLGNIAPNMMQNPLSVVPDVVEHVTQVKVAKGATLTALAEGADLVLASFNEQGVAANVAEYYGIPAAAVHIFPEQIWSSGWLFSLMTQVAEDAQRRELGLPEATEPAPVSLKIQAYDELCLPRLSAEWEDQGGQRPFVGALTLEEPTDADEDVLSWIAAGTPPIYFGLGSTPIKAPDDPFTMVTSACAQLGERVLICTGPNDFIGSPHPDHVKVVKAVNHAAIFPACRAVIQHGGSGTTAAVLRAGIPTLILWFWMDQPLWAAAVEHLKVGFGRPFSQTTVETLVTDLTTILAPRYAAAASEVATRMTKSAESRSRASDLLEAAARHSRSS